MIDAAYMIQFSFDPVGVPLFIPCDPETKHPPIKNWQKLATNDIAELEKLFRKHSRATMLSVATGARSGFWALDVDERHNGEASLSALEAIHRPLPDTCCYATPGGMRYVFTWADGVTIRNRAGDIGPGLDVRGGHANGRVTGQMVVPPSVNAEGGRYEWIKPYTAFHGIQSAPLWFLFLVIFNKRQRERLAKIGVKGHADFGGLLPAEWEPRARELLRPRKATVRLFMISTPATSPS